MATFLKKRELKMKNRLLSLCAASILLTGLAGNVYAEGGKQGGYLAGQVGMVFNPITLDIGMFSNSASINVFAWGANAGYNYQFAPQWLVGGQIGYTSLGSASWSSPVVGGFGIDFASINALASITRLLGKHWYIWGEGGYALGIGEATGDATGSETLSTGILGAGFGYQWKNITTYFRYDHIFSRNMKTTSNDPVFPPVDAISIGVGYVF